MSFVFCVRSNPVQVWWNEWLLLNLHDRLWCHINLRWLYVLQNLQRLLLSVWQTLGKLEGTRMLKL